MEKTRTIPLFTFLAPAEFVPEAEGSSEQEKPRRRFTGIAYSGELITDHRYGGNPLVIDLASMTMQTPAPLLCLHDQEDAIGVINFAQIGNDFRIAGDLFSDIDEDAAAIAAKADAGFPWQLSIGCLPGAIEIIPSGQQVEVNGRTFTGPLDIYRNARTREVSFVSVGADALTTARVFGAGDTYSVPIVETVMPDQANEISDLESRIADLESQLTAERSRADAAEAKAEEVAAKWREHRSAERKAAVLRLFSALGRDADDAAMHPYLEMSDEAFAVLERDVLALKSAATPDYLFSSMVTGAPSDTRTEAEIHRNMLANYGKPKAV